ncbi:hypothetical protein [Salininema proteolyticum]|uniref:Conidiation-specific protein 10 n=1 Tax=Salininema proteolyticum TaxID=1607685 RepID=A0ABV8U3G7_9ACTN
MSRTNKGDGGRQAMDKESASRIQSASDKNPDSSSAKSGFSEWSQSAADKHESDQEKK